MELTEKQLLELCTQYTHTVGLHEEDFWELTLLIMFSFRSQREILGHKLLDSLLPSLICGLVSDSCTYFSPW